MKLKKTRNNRKILRGSLKRNIRAGNDNAHHNLIMTSQNTLLRETHKVQGDSLKFYHDLKLDLDHIKKQNNFIIENNKLIDLEKNINHCSNLSEKKRLTKKAIDLHKKLYPEHRVYNKFLKKIHDNIKIETLTGAYGNNFTVIDPN